MKTIIVAISVLFTNSRELCNLIENQEFESYSVLRDYINAHAKIEEDDEAQPQFFDLSDFMEECNDQLFDFEGTFISYVRIAK